MRTIASLLCLCACAASPATASSLPPQATVIEAPIRESAVPAAPALPELYALDPTRTLTAADVLLQLDDEGGMVLSFVGETSQPFSGTPRFTLYRDGTVVFTERTAGGEVLRIWTMNEREATEHIEHVRALGVAQIRDHTRICVQTSRLRRCVSDGSIWVLRARLPDGTLRELRNYAGSAPRSQERLHAIYDRIEVIQMRYQGAPLYVSRGATLFVAPLARELNDLSPESRARLRPWPLTREILERALSAGIVAIEAPEIRAMIAATGRNIVHDRLFVHDGRLVHATMIPWLPDADHREAIARATALRRAQEQAHLQSSGCKGSLSTQRVQPTGAGPQRVVTSMVPLLSRQ